MLPPKDILNALTDEDQKKEAIKALNAHKLERVQLLSAMDNGTLKQEFSVLVVQAEKIRWEHTFISQLMQKRNIKIKDPWAMPNAEDRKNYKVRPPTDDKPKAKRKSVGSSTRGLDPAQKMFVKLRDQYRKMKMDDPEGKAKSQVEKMIGKPLEMPS